MAAALMQIGGASAFALMIPVLAGFIAFSIADRPGLAPGLIGGMLASSTGAGFLGGIIAGFVAGYAAKFIAEKVSTNTYVNIMPQYRPCGRADEIKALSKHLSQKDFTTALEEAIAEGIERHDSRRRRFILWYLGISDGVI